MSELLTLLRDTPDAVLRRVEAGDADFARAFARAAALVLTDHLDEAVAAAERLQAGLPTRHPATIAAQALAWSGDLEGAVTWAIGGLQRRLSTELVYLFTDTPGLARLDSDADELIRQACGLLVQQGMPQMRARGRGEAEIFLITGLTAPTLQQARQLLERSQALGALGSPLAEAGRLVGLARCARWAEQWPEARALLEQARATGSDAPFIDHEALFLERDAALLASSRVRVEGYKAAFERFRTPTAIGAVYTSPGTSMTQEDDLSDRSPEQIAALYKDQLVALIDSGFSFTILEMADGGAVPALTLPAPPDRTGQLDALLEGPLTPARWGEVVALLERWPGGDDRDAALERLGARLDARPADEASQDVVGLWRLTRVRLECGELDFEDADYGDLDDLKERSEGAEGEWYAEGGGRLLCLLEIRADGRFRELDFSRYPVERVREASWYMREYEGAEDEVEETREAIGIVSTWYGFSHSYQQVDAEGFHRVSEPKALAGSAEVELCYDHPDQILHDTARLADGALERVGWLLWDGLYVTRLTVRYARVVLEAPSTG
ncbi:MAG: hypothetical protein H6739_12960 [Alphaproteobacteria bacterium]|nr:hypothetical protein [Alphaproteobacteria bacterium]